MTKAYLWSAIQGAGGGGHAWLPKFPCKATKLFCKSFVMLMSPQFALGLSSFQFVSETLMRLP